MGSSSFSGNKDDDRQPRDERESETELSPSPNSVNSPQCEVFLGGSDGDSQCASNSEFFSAASGDRLLEGIDEEDCESQASFSPATEKRFVESSILTLHRILWLGSGITRHLLKGSEMAENPVMVCFSLAVFSC